MQRAAWIPAIAGLCLVLSACGFKLRGAVELPPVLADVYIQSENPYTGMARTLRSQLKAAGANVLASPEQASAVLVILGERSEDRVLSVGSSGRASEYELFDQVTYELNDAAGKTLISSQSLHLTRDLVFDENQLLGKLSEADGIHRQMRDNLARRMISRIAAAMRQK